MLRVPRRIAASADATLPIRRHSIRQAASLSAIAACATALAGCGGGGSGLSTKPSAQIRGVEVATNTINVSNTTDYAYVLVNTAAMAGSEPYGVPTDYLYVEAGISGVEGGFPNGQPTITVNGVTKIMPLPTVYDTTTQTTEIVSAPVTDVDLTDGNKYTAYLCGRPDVQNPLNPNLSDLDPRYYRAVVLQDNQAAPPSGSATLRVLNAAADAGSVTLTVNGNSVAAFDNIGYAPSAPLPSTANATVPAGSVSFKVTSTSGAVLVAPMNLTLVSGGKYTLVVDEPSAGPSPAIRNTPPTSATYSLDLVQE